MKIKHLIFLMFSILFLITHAEAVSSNDMYIVNADQTRVSMIGFIPTYEFGESYSISPSESKSWGGWSVKSNNSKLTVKANRSGSGVPVEWVKNNLAKLGISWSSDYMVTPFNINTDIDPPESLNFAIVGTLILKYSNFTKPFFCNNIMIAQGHMGSRNNWWMFSTVIRMGSFDKLILCHYGMDNLDDAYFKIIPGKDFMDMNTFTFYLESPIK